MGGQEEAEYLIEKASKFSFLFSMKILEHVDEYQHKQKSKTFSSLWSTSFVLHFRIKENYATSSFLNDTALKSSPGLLEPSLILINKTYRLRFFSPPYTVDNTPTKTSDIDKTPKIFCKIYNRRKL